MKYGFSDECQAWRQLGAGTHNARVPHDDRCRDRIGELMAEDDHQRQGERVWSRAVPEVEKPERRWAFVNRRSVWMYHQSNQFPHINKVDPQVQARVREQTK